MAQMSMMLKICWKPPTTPYFKTFACERVPGCEIFELASFTNKSC
jgi:hypothetical protein